MRSCVSVGLLRRLTHWIDLLRVRKQWPRTSGLVRRPVSQRHVVVHTCSADLRLSAEGQLRVSAPDRRRSGLHADREDRGAAEGPVAASGVCLVVLEGMPVGDGTLDNIRALLWRESREGEKEEAQRENKREACKRGSDPNNRKGRAGDPPHASTCFHYQIRSISANPRPCKTKEWQGADSTAISFTLCSKPRHSSTMGCHRAGIYASHQCQSPCTATRELPPSLSFQETIPTGRLEMLNESCGQSSVPEIRRSSERAREDAKTGITWMAFSSSRRW